MSEVLMPRLSEAMTEGKLLRCCVAAGTAVSAGDVIAEVETDKANMEIESQENGVLETWLAKPGDMIPVDAPLARIVSG